MDQDRRPDEIHRPTRRKHELAGSSAGAFQASMQAAQAAGICTPVPRRAGSGKPPFERLSKSLANRRHRPNQPGPRSTIRRFIGPRNPWRCRSASRSQPTDRQGVGRRPGEHRPLVAAVGERPRQKRKTSNSACNTRPLPSRSLIGTAPRVMRLYTTSARRHTISDRRISSIITTTWGRDVHSRDCSNFTVNN
jgi:hypothetical protein